MITHRAYSASVRVDGKDLPHFQLDVDADTHTATCWIPSEAGKEFSIWVKSQQPKGIHARVHVFLDGSQKRQMVTTLGSRYPSRVMDKMAIGLDEYSSLAFATVQTTDDDDYLLKSALPMDAGSICVTIKRIRGLTRKTSTLDRAARVQELGSIIVHERSKKAGGHLTQLGPTRTHSSRSDIFLSYEPYTPADKAAYVTFIFRYRPADLVLQSLGEPEIHDNGGMAQKAQILALEAEEAKLDTQRASLAARKAALASRPPVVKHEEIDVRRLFKRGEVIDLTLSICVDGKDLPQFDTEYDDKANVVTCWIYSQPGKEYAIWMRKEAETDYDIAAHVYLDGSEEYATTFCLTSQASERRRSAIPCGPNKERPLIFSDGIGDDPEDPEDVGSIRITAQRVSLVTSEQTAWHPFAGASHNSMVGEDGRKLPGNLTQLGKARSARLRYHRRAIPYRPSDVVPFVTFVFLHVPKPKPVARAPTPEVVKTVEIVTAPSPSTGPSTSTPSSRTRSTPSPAAALAEVIAPRPETSQRRRMVESPEAYGEEEGDEAEDAELLAIEAKKAALHAQEAVLEARIAAIAAERAAAKAERAAALLSGRKYR
ncbi:hypothetical protein FRB98_001276 [Tulasnella sp. 332]|nr:hypothetical protein FRB98_001276 [Tulasnella sp. 332]